MRCARDAGLTGDASGSCEHGVCGACTVLLDGEPVRFLLDVRGCRPRSVPSGTVEGLAQDGELHPLQRAFAAHHGVQCGFCTPGFLMLADKHALERDPDIGDDDLQ